MATPQTIERVLHKAIETASHSWEYSTVFEALLEYHNPDATVFHEPFPNNKIPELDIKLVPALQYVQQYIRTDGDVLCEGNGRYAPNLKRGGM
jgi:FMN-dependent NADH-azoreductase